MPFRRRHEVVGAMVRRLLAEGRDFSTLTMNEWREASDMFGEDAPQGGHGARVGAGSRTPQSTNPEAVASALDESRTG
jgi:argininosuccinate lyase